MESPDGGQTGHSTLDVFDFGVLLQALAQTQREGTLRVACGDQEKYVCLRAGRVEAIYTARSRFPLGRILYNLHAVELADVDAVLAGQRTGEEPRGLGEALLARGLISEEQLTSALEYQMLEELLELLHWQKLSYEFFSGPPERTLAGREKELTRVGGSHHAHGILLQITKLLDDLEKFRHSTPSLRDVYEIVADPEEYLKCEEDAEDAGTVLELIDGQRDMSEIIDEVRLTRFETMEVLYRLREAGLIRAKNAFELFMLAESNRATFSAERRSRLYERIAELGIQGFDISHRRAEVYEQLGRPAEAAEEYLAHSRRREAEKDAGGAEEAVARAIRIAPDRADLRERRAKLLLAAGRPADAAVECLEAARIHRRRGELGEADRFLAAGLAARPDDPALTGERFEVLVEMKRTRAAMRLCLGASRVREAAKDLTGARESIERAIRTAPAKLKPRAELAALLLRSGDREGAAATLGDAVPGVLARFARSPDRAARALEDLGARLKRLRAEASPAMGAIGEAFLRLGRVSRAVEVLKAAGDARIAGSLLKEAREAYALASRAAPEDLDLAETLALLNARLGNREQAVARLKGISAEHRRKGHAAQAERACREILRLDPMNAEAILEMAGLAKERGQRREAAILFFRVGQLNSATENIEGAVASLEEACRLDPSRAEYVRALADALSRALRTDRSIDSFEALLAMLRAREDHVATIDVALRTLNVAPSHTGAANALAESWRRLGDKVFAAVARAGVPARTDAASPRPEKSAVPAGR